MDGIVDYTIPVLHPFAVHFPVALLPACAVAAIVWLVKCDRRWLLAGWYLAVAGALGAVVAYATGDVMKEQSEGVPVVELVVGMHERFGVATLVLSIIAAVMWTAVGLTRQPPDEHGGRSHAVSSEVRLPVRVLVVLVSLAAAAFALRAAHLGGLMVWGVPAN